MNTTTPSKRLSWQDRRRSLLSMTVAASLLGLPSCAVASEEKKMYFHTFSFDTITDTKAYGHPDVEVLYYEYGSSGQIGTRPAKEELETRTTFARQSVSGPMPRGKYLYVKWRVRATNEIHEDRVDLDSLLPSNLNNYGIKFVITGDSLSVYAFPPHERKDSIGRTFVTGGRAAIVPPGSVMDEVPYNRDHRVYPKSSN